MRRLFLTIVTHPRSSLLLALAITVGLCSGLRQLDIDNSIASFFVDSPEVTYFEEVRKEFGGDPVLTVVVRGDSLFTSSTLRSLKELVTALDQTPGVDSSFSLFSAETARRHIHEFRGKTYSQIVSEPLIATIPDTAGELDTLRNHAVSNTVLRGSLVNAEGTAIAIHLILNDSNREISGFDEQVVTDVKETIKRFESNTEPKPEIYVLGSATVKAELTEAIYHDLTMLGPIAIGIVSLVVFIFFRSLLAVFIPFAIGVLSVLATLGLMGHFGFPLNAISSIIILLILIIGCTEDLHLIAAYAIGIRHGLQKQEAIRAMGKDVVGAASLAVLTTVLGFLAIVPSPIPALREFAIPCAAGVLINFVLTLLILPHLLLRFPVPKSFTRPSLVEQQLEKREVRFVKSTIKRRLSVFSIFVLLTIALSMGISRLRVDTNYLRFFHPDSSLMQTVRKFSTDFGGTSMFAVSIESHQKNGIYRTDSFNRIADFTTSLNDRFDHVLSICNLVGEVQSQIGKGASSPVDLPSTEACVSVLPPSVVAPLVSGDGSRALIRVRSSNDGSRGMSEDANEVRRMAKAILPPEYEVRVTGEMLVLHQFADQVTHQLVQGLLLLSTSLAVIFLVVFRSLRLMVVGILANAFPLVVTLGCMGWADIPLSLGTFSVAIVALGMSVDDTIHFMVRFSDEKRRGRVTRDAVSNAFCKEIRPVLATTVAVSVGSLVMCLSSLFINQEGAILYAVAFMSALVADIFLLPCLLSFLGSPSSLLDGFNRLRKAWCPRR